MRIAGILAAALALSGTAARAGETAPASSQIAAPALEPATAPAPAMAPPLAPAAAASSFGKYQPPRQFDGQVTQSLYLPMRDGTRLAVLIARPARDGKPVEGRFPVIWHHSLSATQQDGDGVGPRKGGFGSMPLLTAHGYVVVQVARRGNGQSFGTMRGYHDRNEDADAYELIEWLARQPWSDGKVGQYGCSNTGDAAVHAMTTHAPSLKAVFAGCFSWNKYDAMRRGGIFAQWGTGPTRTIEQDMAIPPVAGDEAKVLLGEAARQHQRGVPLFEVWKALPYRDSFSPQLQSTFWAEGSASSYKPHILQGRVPLYIVGGWRDELRDQGLIALLNIPGSRIVIGDWLHCQNDDFALVQEAHRFFDRHLKGIDTGIDRDPPIRYWTVGGGEWRSATAWPLPQARQTLFAMDKTGLVQAAMPRAAVNRAFPVDYTITCAEGGSGSTVQPCHLPGKGMSLSGKPLNVPLEVTGHPIADIWIAADTPDANLFLYLEDVAPDGTVKVVTEGRLKASLRKLDEAPWVLPGLPWHRAFAEDAQKLRKGEPVRLRFDLMPASHVFRKGHKLQFTLTGSDHRERARDADAQPATITLISDREHPSTVSLPIVSR